jgi:hypothetical protein
MKKKLFYLTLLVTLATTIFSSCSKDDDVIPPQISIEVADVTTNKDLTMPQEDTLRLSAAVKNETNYQAVWKLDDKEVSHKPKYEFIATSMGEHLITLTVTNPDGVVATSSVKVSVYGKFKNGTFILNEGNMTSENGSLIFISPKGVITDSAFFKVNKTPLGNVTQDLFIANNKIYIISQNGNRMGGDMLVVANAETLKKEASYNDELSKTLSWPTHIAVVGSNNVYIRDNKGVYLFNTDTKALKFIDGTDGADKNRMAVVGSKVFVPAGDKLFAIQGEKVDVIKMAGNVSGVLKASDGNLWISCTTTPAQISKLNPSNYAIIKTNEIAEAKIGAGWGATPGISAIGDTLYFSNASTKIYRHIFTTGKTDFMVDVEGKIEDAGIVYNNLAVHPKTGQVFFNTIKGYGWDFLINDISVWKFGDAAPVLKADYKNHTHFPAGIFFTDSFK